MDTVVKSLIEEEEHDKRKLMLFGRDLAQIPCFRESFLYGIMTGVGVGLAAFIKTSKPMKSQHIGFGSFMVTTMVYWTFCRFRWSQQRFDAELMQEQLKERMLKQGTTFEKKLEQEGALKTV